MFVFERVSGAGTVRSWTVMRQSFLPGFSEEVPFWWMWSWPSRRSCG
jgi:hypothetical protein